MSPSRGVLDLRSFFGEGAELVGCEPGASGGHLGDYVEGTPEHRAS